MIPKIKSLKDNLFILLIGIIYFYSFSKLSIGDAFFRSLENNYPLFYHNSYGTYPIWFGFEPAHFLAIPALRVIQIFIAKIGLLPDALLLVQCVNLVLALFTIKILYSLLLRMKVHKSMAAVATVIFAFSYGFYANMNGELHHFSIFLFVAVIWMLLDIESQQKAKGSSIFKFCLCLALLPLFHLETIVFSTLILIYILCRKALRAKFTGKPYSTILGLIITPAILVISSIIFHYIEVGRPDLDIYLSSYLLPGWRINATHNVFEKAYACIKPLSIYIMSRAHLESFSIISHSAKILQHYRDIVFYSNGFSVGASAAIILAYLLIFISVNITAVILAIRNRHRLSSFIWLLTAMLIIYLFTFGLLMSSIFLLPEFFIITAMIQCILLGYLFHLGRKWHKVLFSALAIMTIISNIVLFVYLQKVSAESIARILNELKPIDESKPQDLAVFRIAHFNFPYESKPIKSIKIYFDEHTYDSKANTLKQIELIDDEFKKGKKVILIGPGFLFGEEKEINIRSVLPMGMDENRLLAENLQYLLMSLNENYAMTTIKKYLYNFGTLGQLGKLAVVELKNKGE
ncbi:MAG: hypothetical protein PHG69_02680 [Candidatus Omnitrophica bacterium]|nr:hypothetical protein [Candidatus Omnitrophota bacterium]